MADTAISDLTALTSLADDDLFAVVDDPAGTPTTKKIAASDIKDFVLAGLGSAGTGQTMTGDFSTSVPPTIITANATPGSDGAWTQLVASTAHDVDTILLVVTAGTGASNTVTSTLVEFAVGAAASEVVHVPAISLGAGHNVSMAIPCPRIAAGSRVSARIYRSAVASETIGIVVSLRQSGDFSTVPTTIQSLGIDLANARGTTIATAGSINTFSDWTELEDVTTIDIKRITPCISGPPTTAFAAATGYVQIGVGAAAAEVVVATIGFETNASEQLFVWGNALPFAADIAAGARIAARYQCSSTSTAVKPTVSVIVSD